MKWGFLHIDRGVLTVLRSSRGKSSLSTGIAVRALKSVPGERAVKDAIQLFERVVEIRKTSLAENHPDRLASQHGLVRVYQANGQTKDAFQLRHEP